MQNHRYTRIAFVPIAFVVTTAFVACTAPVVANEGSQGSAAKNANGSSAPGGGNGDAPVGSPTTGPAPSAASAIAPTADGGLDATTPGATLPLVACYDANAVFTPPTFKPDSPQVVGVCSAVGIQTLAAACIGDLNPSQADCTAALQADPACGACVFSTSTDPSWAAMVFSAGGTFFNQAGCVSHLTRVNGCGARDLTMTSCVAAHCPVCASQADVDACTANATNGACKLFALPANDPCVAALTMTNIDACFSPDDSPQALQNLFISMATVQCPSQ